MALSQLTGFSSGSFSFLQLFAGTYVYYALYTSFFIISSSSVNYPPTIESAFMNWDTMSIVK